MRDPVTTSGKMTRPLLGNPFSTTMLVFTLVTSLACPSFVFTSSSRSWKVSVLPRTCSGSGSGLLMSSSQARGIPKSLSATSMTLSTADGRLDNNSTAFSTSPPVNVLQRNRVFNLTITVHFCNYLLSLMRPMTSNSPSTSMVPLKSDETHSLRSGCWLSKCPSPSQNQVALPDRLKLPKEQGFTTVSFDSPTQATPRESV